MRTLRVILLASMIFAPAGSAFAANNSGGNTLGNILSNIVDDILGGNSPGVNSTGGNSKGGKVTAPEFDLKGSLKYELLVIAGGAVLLMEHRRRRRRASLNK